MCPGDANLFLSGEVAASQRDGRRKREAAREAKRTNEEREAGGRKELERQREGLGCNEGSKAGGDDLRKEKEAGRSNEIRGRNRGESS